MQIDTSTEFGARVARRLRDEIVMWLTTVRADGSPDPSPIWFHWDGRSFLIYSQPNTQKLRNIERSPNVALNFDGNGHGGDIIIFSGRARIAPDEPPAHQVPDYAAKYADGFRRIGMTPEQFSQAYSVPIRVTPTKLRGH
jgi:PPOX class probable F420-dependent enzyme